MTPCRHGSLDRFQFMARKVFQGKGHTLYSGMTRNSAPPILTGAVTFMVYDMCVQTLAEHPDAPEY